MEVGTKQSKTAVNASAKAAEPMPKLTTGIPDGQSGSWEDLGGPTPENNHPEGDSNKLKDPASILKTVQDIVNRGAKAADPMVKMKEEIEEDEELEDEEDDDELVENSSDSDLEEESDEDSVSEEDHKVQEEIEEIESQIEEDVNALLSGEELSEEFKFKAKTVFEAALNARTEQIEEAIIAKYEEQLSEEVQAIAENLTERVDSYLEYVSQEWIEENALAVEQGLRSEMTESFLVGMKELFENHYVTIPEERYDVLESMVEKLDDMETKLNEQIERNIALNKRLAESVTDVIISDVSEGLALSQKEKLASLAENVEFDGEKEYREKLVTLRESYFPTTTGTPRNTQDYLVEETTDQVPYHVSGTMDAYLNALERVSKK
jgi:hypothetical protein